MPKMQEIHIWIGICASEEALDRFFEESYDEEDDDAPINRFAVSQAIEYYDHDWVEHSFNDGCTLRDLIDGHSYAADYIDLAIEAATSRDIRSANTFIMADTEDFPDPKDIESDGIKLTYLGKYTCNP